jgi:short-subunit dehydrogenase
MAVYFATKAYVLHFSEAIANELKGTGVTVTALCPGPTESGFQKAADMEGSPLFTGRKLPTSMDVAQYGYEAMTKGKTVAIHGTANRLLANGARFAPRSLLTSLVRRMQEKGA